MEVSVKVNMRLEEIKHRISFIFYSFLDLIGWSKIVMQSFSGLYGTLSAIDAAKILCGEHPAEIFFHWLLFSHPLRIFLFTQVLLLFIAIAEKITIGSYTRLKRELKRKDAKLDVLYNNMKELFDGLLMSFANAELAFGTHEQNQERISLYLAKKDKNNDIDYLYPIGRYSSNPDFRSKRRSRYSINKGCIGEAYRNGYCYNGSITPEECLNKYSYSEDEYKAMRMKSKTVAAISIKDKSDRVIGVLVAESQEISWLSGTIKRKLEKQAKYYAEICMTLKDYIDDKTESKFNKKGDMPW